MELKGKILEIGDRKIYLVKGIFDYFDDKNFPRLLKEYEQCKEEKAEFYVGLYSDEILERANHTRKLKDKVKNQDRIHMLEALDFVDGAFIINTLQEDILEIELKARLQEQEKDKKEEDRTEKKYDIGYASGAFSNLHKGHIEHLEEMKKQCATTIVAANSDRLIREYKHKTASIDESTRRLILSHIKYVDMAIITDEYDKMKALEIVRNLCGKYFNAIFVGSDWKGNTNWENFEEKLKKMGIDVVFTDRPKDGISTTKIDNIKKKNEISK